jgi:hypothetical protein
MKNFTQKSAGALVLGLLVFLQAGCENPAGTVSNRAAAGPLRIDINDVNDLNMIGMPGYPLDGTYDLTADLELVDWIPSAPNNGNAFSGQFNGNGHTITIKSFDSTYGGQYLGVLGYINGPTGGPPAQVNNLTVAFDFDSLPLEMAANYIGGIAGYIGNALVGGVSVTGSISCQEISFLYIGGITGYLSNTAVTKSFAEDLAITGASGSIVYVGGLAGYGNASKFTACSASGSVSGTGQGDGSAAGGIAGLIGNTSTIESCSATNSVSLSAGAGSTASLFNAYAGGVVGYTSYGSRVTQSYATGTVSVTSAYPYAGGLAGYNTGRQYGLEGSTISQCYATGGVTATAINNGLPVAGGLAGYNGFATSTIEDSYATGTVAANGGTPPANSAYAWAGGLVGANADTGLIIRCYATGSVTAAAGTGTLPGPAPETGPGALAGGIVGYNYATKAIVQYCAALNKDLTSSTSGTAPLDVNRVVGRNGTGTPSPVLIVNYGYTRMSLTPSHAAVSDTSGVDGGSCAAQPTQSNPNWYYDVLAWDFGGVWKVGSIYPVLQRQP